MFCGMIKWLCIVVVAMSDFVVVAMSDFVVASMSDVGRNEMLRLITKEVE